MGFVFLIAMASMQPNDKTEAADSTPPPTKAVPYPTTPPRIIVCPDGTRVFKISACRPAPIAVDRSRAAMPRNNRSRWVTTNDYPSIALYYDMQGTTGIRMTVGTTGRSTNCTVTSSSGYAELDKAACRAAERRARFRPALDKAGNPVVGSYSTRIWWQIPRFDPLLENRLEIMPVFAPDYSKLPRISDSAMLMLEHSDYPAAALARGEEGSATVKVSVDKQGKVIFCKLVETSGSGDLDKRSCEIVRDRWTFDTVLDAEGKPLASAPEFRFYWYIEEEQRDAMEATP